jgi:serine/threonine protein kinase
MTTVTREYLQTNFTSVRSLKKTDEAAIKIVSGPDGAFYVLKKTRRTGLPYARLQALTHPALPKIYYVDEAEGFTLVLEEYINGRNLADLAATGSLPPEQVEDIALQLCSVLSLLHRQPDPAPGYQA